MKFRLHPILLPIFLFLIVTGDVSTYTIIFISLLVHEAGHLIAAKKMGMKVRSCIIMPYGGELIIPGRLTASRKDRVILAMGGPLATIGLFISALIISFPGNDLVARVQLFLLSLNLMPILPLDGGQALTAILAIKGDEYSVKSAMLIYSIIVLIATIIVLSLLLPETFPYLILSCFLLIQNIASYRYRKYEKAFLDLKIKMLTK